MADYGEAIKAVKEGKKIRRESWNTNNYVVLAVGLDIVLPNAGTLAPYDNAISSGALILIGARNMQVGWIAAHADTLAEDWEIEEAETEES